MAIMTGLRFDFGTRRPLTMNRSDEGYLKGNAPIAKVGVMSYMLPDGTIRREFVPPETLFNADSMKTLHLKPVTNVHPPERILDNQSVKSRKVGFTGENITQEDTFLVSSLVVTDSDAIKDIDGGRRELSPGYRCELEMTPGTYNGEHYDAIQSKRVYNHVAIVDRARGGSDIRLRMDGEDFLAEDGTRIDGVEENEDAVLSYQSRQNLPDSAFAYVKTIRGKKVRKFPIHDKAHVRNALARLPQSNLSPEDKAMVMRKVRAKAKTLGIEVSNDSFDTDDFNFTAEELNLFTKERRMDMVKVSVNNLDYECAPEVKNHIAGLSQQIADLTKNRDELQGKLDSANDELKKLKEVNVDEKVKTAVGARLSLERTATPHLDEETVKKLDSMSDVEIKKAVILKAFPDAKEKIDAKDVSEVYIQARYDAAIEVLKKDEDKKNDGDKNMADQRKKANGQNNDENKNDELDQDAARKRMIDRQQHPEKYNEDGTLKTK